MKKIILIIPLLILTLSGCYDMTDIEDIETVTTICVEPENIIYCTVTTVPGEKNYGYRLYSVKTSDLHKGINEISMKTGKKISVSHLDSIIFGRDCDISLIKSVCDSAVGVNDFHPKIMTAFTDMSPEDFFSNISVPDDTVMYRHISDVFHNRYAVVTECTVIELYRSLHNQGPGVNVPVFTLDADGNIISDGICHINYDRSSFFNTEFADTVNLLENRGKPIYYSFEDRSFSAVLTDGRVEFDKNKNSIKLYMEFNINQNGKTVDNTTINLAKEKITSDIIKICNEKNNGYDILNLSREMLKSFFSEEEYNRYRNEQGGYYMMMKNLDFDVETAVSKEDT